MNKRFYATLGQCHAHRVNGITVDCDSLVVINAPNYYAAYEFAQELFGGKWGSLYDEMHPLDLTLFPRGIVLELQANGGAQ